MEDVQCKGETTSAVYQEQFQGSVFDFQAPLHNLISYAHQRQGDDAPNRGKQLPVYFACVCGWCVCAWLGWAASAHKTTSQACLLGDLPGFPGPKALPEQSFPSGGAPLR